MPDPIITEFRQTVDDESKRQMLEALDELRAEVEVGRVFGFGFAAFGRNPDGDRMFRNRFFFGRDIPALLGAVSMLLFDAQKEVSGE